MNLNIYFILFDILKNFSFLNMIINIFNIRTLTLTKLDSGYTKHISGNCFYCTNTKWLYDIQIEIYASRTKRRLRAKFSHLFYVIIFPSSLSPYPPPSESNVFIEIIDDISLVFDILCTMKLVSGYKYLLPSQSSPSLSMSIFIPSIAERNKTKGKKNNKKKTSLHG